MSMGLDPLRDVRGVGIDEYRAGMGEYLSAVASDAWANGPLASAGRIVQVATENTDAVDRGEPMLSPQEATERGQQLGLRFEEPISQGAFNVLADEKRRQVAAETTFRRARLENGYGTLHWLLGGGTEFLTQAVDPLNVASAFVPVVGEARFALMAERMGPLFASVARGAIEGAAGQALLEPIAAVNARQQGEDYSLLNTLIDVGFGSGLGVALHGAAYGVGAGFRFIRDRFAVNETAAPPAALPHETVQPNPVSGERPNLSVEKVAEPPPRQPVAERMEELRPEVKDAAMRTAVAQLAQDKPVDIEPVLAADPAWPRVKAEIEQAARAEIEQLQARSAAAWKDLLPSAEPPPEFQPSPAQLQLATRLSRGWEPDVPLRTPQSLVDFVRKNGGLVQGTPEAAELQASDLGRQPGLLRTREKGRQADHMAQAVADAGYRLGRDTQAGSGVDVDAFIKALIEDASGSRKHYPADAHTDAWRAQQDYFREFRRDLEERGIQTKGRDPRQLAWLLAQDPHTARLMTLAEAVDRIGPETSLEVLDLLDRERARLEAEILAEEPGAVEPDGPIADHRDIPAATLDELERYYADIERTAGPRETGDQAPGAGPPGGRPQEGGAAAPARPARPDDPAAAAGLRQQGREGAGAADQGTAPDVTPEELARWSERQRTADLHADPDALALRDERLAGEARETAQLLAEDLAAYGHLLDDDTRLQFDETARAFDEETKAIDALAACRMGGA